MVSSSPDSNPRPPAPHMNYHAFKLLQHSLSASARKSYKKSWQLLFQTCIPTPKALPLSIIQICNFIGSLFSKQYSPSTITSLTSAISYIHKLANCYDPTSSFIVRKLLKGCNKLAGRTDTRLPITKDILLKLIEALKICISDTHHRILLRAIFLLAFNAFLRLGEILVREPSTIVTVLQKSDVNIHYDNIGYPTSVSITLRHYKNMTNNQPTTISISGQTNRDLCPVLALHIYLTTFNPKMGPFFQFQDGSPVKHSFVAGQLSHILKFLGLDPKLYLGHSFRIGAATHFVNLGYSEAYIRKVGRWNSNAVQKYIRIHSFKL